MPAAVAAVFCHQDAMGSPPLCDIQRAGVHHGHSLCLSTFSFLLYSITSNSIQGLCVLAKPLFVIVPQSGCKVTTTRASFLMPYRVLCKRFLEPPAGRLQKSFTQNSVWHQ